MLISSIGGGGVDTPDYKSKGRTAFLTSSREMYRFALAFTILVIFALMLVSALWGGYADPVVLGGMFSGWIVAIVGFYFMDEASQRSLGQETRRALDDCNEGIDESQAASLKEKDAVIKDLWAKLNNMANSYHEERESQRETIKEYEETIKALVDEVEDQRKFIVEFSEMMKQIGPPMEGVNGG
jgi:uncharacterized membrane protein YccC